MNRRSLLKLIPTLLLAPVALVLGKKMIGTNEGLIDPNKPVTVKLTDGRTTTFASVRYAPPDSRPVCWHAMKDGEVVDEVCTTYT